MNFNKKETPQVSFGLRSIRKFKIDDFFSGGVFTSQFLTGSKRGVDRLGRIVGRRAGVGAKQNHDQHCLCLSTQEVTPLMRCDKWEFGDFSALVKKTILA